MILATILIGVLAGFGSIAFHFLADRFGAAVFAWAESLAASRHLPFVVLVPAIGLGLVGLVLQFYPESRSGGVREVLESIQVYRGVVSAVRLANVALSGLVLAFGGSVGPEGPMVQMGAVVGSLIGCWA